MATLPEPETLAVKILSIFVDQYHCRPNGVLQPAVFYSVWPKLGYQMDDFNRGADFAAANGWLEMADHGYRITEAGFVKGGGSIPTPEECASEMLSLCVGQFRVRPNGAVQVGKLNIAWQTKLHLPADDLVAGIELAIEKGWVEEIPGGSLRLTEAGFAVA